MAETDPFTLYSARLLALAAEIPLSGRLPAPQGSGRRRSTACGSTITADVVLQDGRIAEFAQEVRACALGQASASILGRVVLGQDRAALARARQELAAMLKDAGAPPAAPFAEYEALVAARDYPNRHGSILLALEATIDAIDAAESGSGGGSGA
ncbi:iron-sulfur cluster assembly scaffold protein [Pseudogemmobacter sonorensis]|uniref:iron-sulfur cluster assembly scaffold protein n=1 Tax=Pseudogemmobacter sonorensis TaxID=2989681 RepID=UPI00369FA6C5